MSGDSKYSNSYSHKRQIWIFIFIFELNMDGKDICFVIGFRFKRTHPVIRIP
jgi:hypothetical protein